MEEYNVYAAKARLSEILDRVIAGETVLLCRRNQPVAELRPLKGRRTSERPEGVLRGSAHLPPEFFDPLPPAYLDAFEGRESALEPHEPPPDRP